MLDKLTRVSPPQTDSLSKNQRADRPEELGAKGFSHDFKQNLKSQLELDQKKIDQQEKPKSFKAEQKESQPGEKKKRVAKSDDREIDEDNLEEEGEKKLSENGPEKFDPTMISMNMVSIESEVEIPDVEQNLAMIEDSKSNVSKNVELSTQLSAQSLFSDPQLEPIPPEQLQAESSVDLNLTEESPEIVVQPNMEMQDSGVPEESLPKLTGAEPAPAEFQQKVMDVLKLDQTTLPESKLELLKEKLAALPGEPQEQVAGPAISSTTDQFMKNNSDNFEQQNSADTQSSQDEVPKTDSFKIDSHHVGQSEFGSQLATRGAVESQSTAQASVLRNDVDLEPNVNELMNQANYLVTKGGGEVTLKMNSVDGMGEVHLKVMMDNGKMNIELSTEDKSVKKLIEESLSDLRSSLASRQISLEHVKINSVNATSTENNSQTKQNNSNNSGSESNQSKTFAQLQQQMQQQSQQHQLRHQSQKSFSRNNFDLERPVVLPMVNVQKSIARNYYGLNKGSSLNAVA